MQTGHRGRRGEIREAIARLYYQGRSGYVVIAERGSRSSGVRSIPLESVERLGRGYLVLRDGTIIPLHRVLEVVDERGRTIYRRAGGSG